MWLNLSFYFIFFTTMRRTLFVLLLLLCISWVKAQEQMLEPFTFKGKHQPSVMILGVFHFDYPGLDAYKEQHQLDVLSEERQQEIDDLFKLLKEYRPTKILLEADRIESDSLLNARYNAYLKKEFDISDRRNEIYQLGFKLAEKMNHDRIYCIDAVPGWCGVDLDWDTFDEDAYMDSLGQLDKMNRYDYERFYQWADSIKMHISLTEYFKMLNDPKTIDKSHQPYLTEWLLSGAGDNYLGADSLARWYRRNIRIFSNIYDIADFDSEDRMLLIIGSGHVKLLKQMLTDSPDFNYVEINTYL